jgi:hypothetical protein
LLPGHRPGKLFASEDVLHLLFLPHFDQTAAHQLEIHSPWCAALAAIAGQHPTLRLNRLHLFQPVLRLLGAAHLDNPLDLVLRQLALFAERLCHLKRNPPDSVTVFHGSYLPSVFFTGS